MPVPRRDQVVKERIAVAMAEAETRRLKRKEEKRAREEKRQQQLKRVRCLEYQRRIRGWASNQAKRTRSNQWVARDR